MTKKNRKYLSKNNKKKKCSATRNLLYSTNKLFVIQTKITIFEKIINIKLYYDEKKINLQTNYCLNHVVNTTLQHVYPP